MSHGLNKTLQMCTVKIGSGLGYKSSLKSKSKSKSRSLNSKSMSKSKCFLFKSEYKSSKMDFN